MMNQTHTKIKLRWDRIAFVAVAFIIIVTMLWNLIQGKQATNTPTNSAVSSAYREPVRGEDGVYRIDGTIIVNKKYKLPETYAPGANPEAVGQLKEMLSEMRKHFNVVSDEFVGYRSFQTQTELYEQYVSENGKEKADTFSARPGFSEHQTGLAFDLVDEHGELLKEVNYPEAARWIAENAHRFGFIVRYLPTKEDITGYMREEWHIRYLGSDLAQKVYESNKCLEEYFNIKGGSYE